MCGFVVSFMLCLRVHLSKRGKVKLVGVLFLVCVKCVGVFIFSFGCACFLVCIDFVGELLFFQMSKSCMGAFVQPVGMNFSNLDNLCGYICCVGV